MDEEKERPWPRKGDVAFGRGSHPDLLTKKIATIDHLILHPHIGYHADGFREAADIIVDRLERENYMFYPGNLFAPIAYLYRHAIELDLKLGIEAAIAIELVERTRKVEDVLSGHNLHRLWNVLKPAILKFWSDSSPDVPNAAEQIIRQFHDLDKSGQSFRYATTTDGRPSIEDSPNVPRHVDLVELKKVAGGLCSFLDGCYSGFDDAYSNMPREYGG